MLAQLRGKTKVVGLRKRKTSYDKAVCMWNDYLVEYRREWCIDDGDESNIPTTTSSRLYEHSRVQHGQHHETIHRPTLSWNGEPQVLSSSVAESDLHPQASCRLASAELRWSSGVVTDSRWWHARGRLEPHGRCSSRFREPILLQTALVFSCRCVWARV